MRPDVRSGYVAAKSTHIGPPSEMPNSVARSDPAASITARTSSMRCSSEGKSTRRSESPVPRRSSMMSRENDASRVRKRAYEGSSQAYSTWETQPGTRTRSGPASPTTWYAMWTSPLFAYFVSARMNGQLPPCEARRQCCRGRPRALSLGTCFLLRQPGLTECEREGFADLWLQESSEFQEAEGTEGWLQLQKP